MRMWSLCNFLTTGKAVDCIDRQNVDKSLKKKSLAFLLIWFVIIYVCRFSLLFFRNCAVPAFGIGGTLKILEDRTNFLLFSLCLNLIDLTEGFLRKWLSLESDFVIFRASLRQRVLALMILVRPMYVVCNGIIKAFNTWD